MRVYRGREGQWAWILHRISGLGVLLFLCLHVVDTSLLLAGEEAYNHLIRALYRQWWFQPLEVALGAALVYHALNGVRLTLIDFWDGGVRYERQLRRATAGLFVLVMLPLAAAMLWPFVGSALMGGR
ncbi:MAG TPA: succinate dehydrogenase, cytochrome b556 subunit [Chloroflexota bacterium]|nr:succinate dehydrogenase, cytochrome b556 subunit [Chloroflexota bacterium]